MSGRKGIVDVIFVKLSLYDKTRAVYSSFRAFCLISAYFTFLVNSLDLHDSYRAKLGEKKNRMNSETEIKLPMTITVI